MGRKPTVGTKAEHSEFARNLTDYLGRIRDDSGLSIRGLSALTVGKRSNSWWADIFNGNKILTTNDIAYIATDLLGISPYVFVANARKHAAGQPLPLTQFSVGGATDDDYQQAANEDQTTPERKVAKRGRLKADQAFEGEHEGTTGDGGESGT